MLFKFSNLNSNLALTLGYFNAALNNSTLVETYIINLVFLFVLCRYELMSQCWVESDKRPSVPEIESALLSLMSGRSVPQLTSNGILKQKAGTLLDSHG